MRDYLTTVAPRAILYEAARRGWIRTTRPLTLTFSVTAACQSRCLTCNIGNRFLANPRLAKENLTLEEIEKVFRSLGPVYFFNISGGEPFLRRDLAEIVRLALVHLKPRLIHIPTNAISPLTIGRTTEQILKYMDELADISVPISIKPSIDGVGTLHDHVRGYAGNFHRLEQTLDVLLALRRKNPRLHVDLGTVISNHNIDHLDAIEDWVHERGVESYRHEIAEQRSEFFNLGDPITPPADVYEALTENFKRKILENVSGKALLTRTTEAVRLVYYDVAVRILKERRQVTPCYAGHSNIHMNYNGEIWPCCVLGSDQALGNVREWDFDVFRLLGSDRALASKRYIAEGRCACPLANQWLNNVLLTPRHMMKVLFTLFVRFGLGSLRRATRHAGSGGSGREAARATWKISGTRRARALVMDRLGTIPAEEREFDVPVMERIDRSSAVDPAS
ncbi:MAG: radical SAM protein [Candidatus Hydrogenedentota bacterium]